MLLDTLVDCTVRGNRHTPAADSRLVETSAARAAVCANIFVTGYPRFGKQPAPTHATMSREPPVRHSSPAIYCYAMWVEAENSRVRGGSRGRLQDRFVAWHLHAGKHGSGGLGTCRVRLLRLIFGLEELRH